MKLRQGLLSLPLCLSLLTPAAAQVQVSGNSPAEMLEAVTRLQLRETAGTLFENVVAMIRTSGHRVGYLHFWFVHIAGVPDLITQSLAGRLRAIDALVIDLRGRGGSATEIPRIVTIVREYRERTGRPVVALVDRQSRSGKDILAHEFKAMGVRLVGEASAGAVIPASFGDVGFDSVLMFPMMRLPQDTDLLEFKPVPPDVEATRPGLYAAGRDGILDAGIAEAVRLTTRR